jgi:uncharacterized membrane protein YdjX (TVP38/TMEM64 family)
MTEDILPPDVADRSGRRLPVRRGLLLALVLLLVGSFYALGGAEHLSWEEIQGRRAALQQLAEAHPLLAPLLFFLIYTATMSAAIPLGPPLSVLAGTLFERILGTLLVSFASTAGASVAFLLSRYLFRDFVQRHWGARLETIQRGVARDGIYYLLALRLSPLVPYTLVNIGMSLTGMPLRTFWWVSQLGMLPISFCFVNAGAELRYVQSPQEILSPALIAWLTLAALVPLLGRLLWTSLRRNAAQPERRT